ncbi:MAG: carboxypeptidase-like regulatory domain-containing protein [Gemmatimonadaceae bacterium]
MRRFLGWLLVTTALLATVGRPGLSQHLRGTIHASTSGVPIPGAVIIAIDSAGTVVSRAVAGADGGFMIAVGSSASALRFIRIGFHPREIALPSSGAERGRSVNLTMVRLPALLSAVRVSDRPVCPGASGGADALELWEQARDGLLAAVVARKAKPAQVRTVLFERDHGPNDERVLHQTLRTQTGSSTDPFLALIPPREFAAHGYMRQDASGRTYYAPDADVLLDESFANTHCFHAVAGNAAHPGQIGLAFAPVAGRDSLVDVAGTLWLDSATPGLRTLEFRFTGVEPAAAEAGAGGSEVFMSMPNGVVLIERWLLRLPVLAEVAVSTADAPLRLSALGATAHTVRHELRVRAIHEVGGEVVRAAWPDGARWVAPLGTIAGVVAEIGATRSIGGVLVTIDGTVDSATTGPEGRYVFTDVFPGRYTVRATDTALTAHFASRTMSRNVDVKHGDTTDAEFTFPGDRTGATRLCERDDPHGSGAMLVGRLSRPGAALPQGVVIHAAWLAGLSLGKPGATTHVMTISRANRTVAPDTGGWFYICGVARGRPVKLEVEQRSVSLADSVLLMPDNAVVGLDWKLRDTRDSAGPSH